MVEQFFGPEKTSKSMLCSIYIVYNIATYLKVQILIKSNYHIVLNILICSQSNQNVFVCKSKKYNIYR